jgi:DNA repair protein RecN (Recombination protein N)
MLKSLYISSFVIIDKMRVDFYQGMSALTGETGAGKSIIIDALGQLCGNRASTSFIKKDCQKAVIEGIFEVDMSKALENICDELHIEPDEQFVVTKEILSSGKSNVKINYQNASNNALKMIMPYFIDIHSQFETQKIFEEKNHIQLIDQYAYKDLKSILNDYQIAYQDYQSVSRQLKKSIEEDMSDEQLDFLMSQLNEIDEVTYTDNEVEELEEELKSLQNIEKINEVIQNFDHLMNHNYGVLPQFKDALSSLQNVVNFGHFNDSYDSLYNQYYNLMDEYENVMDIYRSLNFDEYRFNELQDILYKINRLKRKYGFTMERVMEYRQELQEKIDFINHREEHIHALQSEVTIKKQIALELAEKIHNLRIKNARKFENDIHKELQDLYLDKAQFKVNFEKTELNKNGFDEIKFMISVNKGQNLSLLNESASGGEISRIMLAIKTIILKYSPIETIIFDEVDTGVSGKVATSIGDKMLQLAKQKQVICITHLPQVASLADYQYSIEKTIGTQETLTSIHLLKTDERVTEIAKMLSGEQITQEAIENAKKLLNV